MKTQATPSLILERYELTDNHRLQEAEKWLFRISDRVSFEAGVASDDANTFFGNPPEHSAYNVNGRIVSFGTSKYVISKDLSDLVTVSGSATEGTVLDLQR